MLRQVEGGNLTFHILDHSLIPSHTLTATKFLYEDCYLNYVQREFPLNTKKIPFSKIKRKLYDALAHLLTFIKKNLSFRLKLNKGFWLERKKYITNLVLSRSLSLSWLLSGRSFSRSLRLSTLLGWGPGLAARTTGDLVCGVRGETDLENDLDLDDDLKENQYQQENYFIIG